MTSEQPTGPASDDYQDPGLDGGSADEGEREAALDAMPQGNAESGDQVDREAFDLAGPDEEVEED